MNENLMTDATKMPVRILKLDAEGLAQSKDEEYAYWQSRSPLERLVGTQELSFALFGLTGNKAELRQLFLRSPKCLPCPWSVQTSGERELTP